MSSNILFEVSFEVANMVGGIHTVISTKVPYISPHFDQYILIGPYFENQAKKEFTKLPIPNTLHATIEELKSQGIIAHYGKWLVKGNPQTILLEYNSQFRLLPQKQKELYDNFKVESHNAPHDVAEPMAFSLAASKLIEIYTYNHNKSQQQTETKIRVHAHEWMCGYTNLFLKLNEQEHKVKFPLQSIKTIFTTHATILGRTLSNDGTNIDNHNFDPMQKAQEFNIVQKFTAERACAQYSDVFTTVSDTTAHEAEFILSKKPDILTYNGVPNETFPDLTNIQLNHLNSRKKLQELIQYVFFPHHTFDIEKSTIVFTSGRHEIHNKGIDITIEALGKLNQELKGTDKTVVCFIWVPFETYGVKQEILEQKITFQHINEEIQSIVLNSYTKAFKSLCDNADARICLSKNERLAHILEPFKKNDTAAPLTTHHVRHNQILDLLKQASLNNNKEDNVKIVYYPTYLDKFDNLLNMDYYSAIAGCDLGIFPSYYEPWGYTPAEAIALGVPAITSNLAGFGQYMKDKDGVYTIKREANPTTQILTVLKSFVDYSDHEIARLRTLTKLCSEEIDWKKLIAFYLEAYQ